MVYLSEFVFPDEDREHDFRMSVKRTCYDTFYPFYTLSKHVLSRLDFEPVTILYGGNGSGKTTALNVIAETLGLERDAPFNRSDFFKDYTSLCSFETERKIPPHSRIITSDDVFDFMLDLRSINDGVDRERTRLFDEYIENKRARFRLQSLEDYDELKKICLARRTTQSKYVKKNNVKNVREHSNGESAYLYFTAKIKDDGLYLLDEPENSLSPARQLELLNFLENSARFFGCQIIIATHSPFLLSMHGAKIYDLDSHPVDVKKWTELENVKTYYDFFASHRSEFENKD